MVDSRIVRVVDEPLPVKDGVELRLRVYERPPAEHKAPVLLLHGASAASQTFEFPRGRSGAAGEGSFVDYLLEATPFEPWLLDWRCSRNVTEPFRTKEPFDDRFTYDGAARIDIPAALTRIRERYATEPLRIVGHCMGAESLSRAIAYGELHGDFRPKTVVLSAIGLFYEVAVDGRLKADDHLLERLSALRRRDQLQNVDRRNDFVDPTCLPDGALRNAWPLELEGMYDAWPRWLRPHGDGERRRHGRGANAPRHVLEMCDRVSFMFGEPYYEPALHPAIHESPSELAQQFGMMPLPMYVHAAQCVRRGWAAPYDERPTDRSLIDEQARRQFDGIDILLITGAMNRLWHRDSIDRMYEWLRRGDRHFKDRFKKRVFVKNGHQDLFWGKDSWREVFPEIGGWLMA